VKLGVVNFRGHLSAWLKTGARRLHAEEAENITVIVESMWAVSVIIRSYTPSKPPMEKEAVSPRQTHYPPEEMLPFDGLRAGRSASRLA
jgi:hypothetical protein